MKRFLLCTFTLAAALAHAADRPRNIFDEDWTPPKTAETPRTTPIVTPPVVQPAQKTAPDQPPATPPTKLATPDRAITAPPPPPARLAVPDKPTQAAVRKTMRDVFSDQLADRSIPTRRKLTLALLAQVDKSAEAPVDQFVLLAAAIDAAVDAVDLPTACRAADRMAAAFDVDALGVKADAALRLGPKSAIADTAAENVVAAIELSTALVRVNDFATAARVCAALQPAAATNPTLRAQLQQRQREVNLARDAADRFERDLAKLKDAPNDPAANLAVGRYTCFVKGDWDGGLPMLANGTDATLKAQAALELAKPAKADELARVADGWWDAAAKQPDAASKAAIIDHAAALYQRAVPELTGLVKAQAEKRITEAEKLSARTAGKPVVNLLKWVDVKRDAVEGTWKKADDGSGLESPADGFAKIALRYEPPAEYDFRVEFTRRSGAPCVAQVFSQAGRRCLWVSGWHESGRGFETVNGRYFDNNATSVKGPSISTIGQRYSSVVQVRKGSVSAYLDGKLVVEYKTEGSDLGLTKHWSIGERFLGLGTEGTKTVFQIVEVREISGSGKLIP
jgi:hypothetical protein